MGQKCNLVLEFNGLVSKQGRLSRRPVCIFRGTHFPSFLKSIS